jgi:hypothetical protein
MKSETVIKSPGGSRNFFISLREQKSSVTIKKTGVCSQLYFSLQESETI